MPNEFTEKLSSRILQHPMLFKFYLIAEKMSKGISGE